MSDPSQLIADVERADSPEAIKKILFSWQGTTDVAISAIARRARAFDDDLVSIILAAGIPPFYLCRNQNLPERYYEPVAQWNG